MVPIIGDDGHVEGGGKKDEGKGEENEEGGGKFSRESHTGGSPERGEKGGRALASYRGQWRCKRQEDEDEDIAID